MATYTDNYNLVKPTMAESADIRTINGNMDSVDNIMHATQVSLAPAYDSTETYNTGDIVMYEFLMYECLDDGVTGTWNATKWQRTTAGEHGGGGGGSDVEITPTLQSGTKIADFEIDGVEGALYAPSGGGGGGGSSQTIADVLWSGAETPTYPTTYTATLSHSYSDYDLIVFDGIETDSDYQMQYVLNVNDIIEDEVYIQNGDGDSGFVITFLDDTSVKLEAYNSSHATTYTKITGLKFCGILAPMIYSAEEREVGVWVDDKPLYQKSYLLSTPIEITTNGIVIDSYIDNYQDIECFVRGQASYTENTYGKQGADIWVGYDGGALKAYCSEGCMANVITLLYTKTADTAGSGSYGSLGVPMEHYDDTERVVGTWFGDTLYQVSKTGSFSTGTFTALTLNDNIGTLVSYEAALYYPTTNQWLHIPYFEGSDRVYLITNDNLVKIVSNSSMSVYTKYALTIKYTKSTT